MRSAICALLFVVCGVSIADIAYEFPVDRVSILSVSEKTDWNYRSKRGGDRPPYIIFAEVQEKLKLIVYESNEKRRPFMTFYYNRTTTEDILEGLPTMEDAEKKFTEAQLNSGIESAREKMKTESYRDLVRAAKANSGRVKIRVPNGGINLFLTE